MRHLIDLTVHPAADLFPMLEEEALTMLENDIKLNGQLMPIRLWNGAIVDGRNRYAACIRGGVKPKTKDIDFADDADCVRYIISTNIHRRHLTTSQRAMIASELATLGEGRPANETAQICAVNLSQPEAADQMQVSRRLVQTAREVQQQAPDLAAKVKSGELKVSKAASMARERAKPLPAPTDYNNADDSVIDKKDEANATGYTPKMEKVWSAYSALDAVEQTAFRERLEA